MPTVDTPTIVEEVAANVPDYCVPAETGILQEIESTRASPYFVHHPTVDNPLAPTVVFLPGGSGSRRSAQRAWERYLSEGDGMETFRLIVPYSDDIDLLDDTLRTYRILDEVLECYGGDANGDANKVHVGGVSNGGHGAYVLMLVRPERFVTLFGAPGEFPTIDPARWAESLKGRSVFNGVGASDEDWIPGVKATRDGLVEAGIDSVYMEFPGQGHIVSDEFDESIFFEFWMGH